MEQNIDEPIGKIDHESMGSTPHRSSPFQNGTESEGRGSITLFSSDTKSTDFETDYKTNIFDSKQNSKVNYTNSDIFISSTNIDGNSIPKHTVGFYLTPGAQETFAYLLKVNLPAQSFGSTDSSYIGAKLFIDLDIHATQVQQKS